MADLRVMITNLPEETKHAALLSIFLRQSMQFIFKGADLFEKCVIVTGPAGRKEAVATFRTAAAAIACIIYLDQIEYIGKELSIQCPYDYVPPVDGDPADRVVLDGDINELMLDGNPLLISSEGLQKAKKRRTECVV